jgi:cardiolipin synthase
MITLLRFLLIPLFALLAVQYGRSIDAKNPDEAFRWIAIATYTVASMLDGLDGWIARTFNQQSLTGAIMDPLVDKSLLITGLMVATFVNWGADWHLPIWFIILVIIRDLVIILGIICLYFLRGKVPIQPHWTGKICTVTQMIATGWIMLKVTPINPLYPTILASIFTIWSGIVYCLIGYQLLQRRQSPT